MERAEPLPRQAVAPVALAAPAGRLKSGTGFSDLERPSCWGLGIATILVAPNVGSRHHPANTDFRSAYRPKTLGDLMLTHSAPPRAGRGGSVGRPYPGSYGIARSYEEAREGLTMAVQLGLDSVLIQTEQLLVYRVVLRDQPAIADLVQSVLGQLVHARGGAEPFLATLDAYFATGAVTTETARRLHLSVRAVPTAPRTRLHRK